MYSKTTTAILDGYVGKIVEIESAMTSGLPSLSIIGLAGATVKESADRIRAAIKSVDASLPPKRLTVNLSPAELRKNGAHLDLGIAVTILSLIDVINLTHKETCSFIGELALDGKILPLKGVLVIVEQLKNYGIKEIVLPYANYEEASYIEGIEIIPVKTLEDVIAYVKDQSILIFDPADYSNEVVEEILYTDYKNIKGQEGAKRALMVALVGGHNMLMVGPAGTGKTMLAENIPSLLPKMSLDKSVEVAKLYGASGRDGIAFVRHRQPPFRSPHHSVGKGALIGGGLRPVPGEISLAHNGILFLDELGEFKSEQLDYLREPLVSKTVTLTRLGYQMTYPANFTLIAAMNPCKCGFYGSQSKQCTCTAHMVKLGMSRLSKPFLDRIDIIYWIGDIDYAALVATEDTCIDTYEMKGAIERAIAFRESTDDRETWSKACEKLLETGYKQLDLSPRTLGKVRRIAQTISILEGSQQVLECHVLEALQYRRNEKLFRGDGCI